MKDKFKDLFLFGMGSASLAKEIVEDFVDEMIRNGQAQSDERQKLVNDFGERARSTSEEFQQRMKDGYLDLVKEMNLVTRQEFEEGLDRLTKEMNQVTRHEFEEVLDRLTQLENTLGSEKDEGAPEE